MIEIGALPESVWNAFANHEVAWRKRTHGRAFKEFEQAMVDALESHITKLSVDEYDQAVQNVIEKYRDNVYVYTRELAKSLKADGYFLIAISGSQTELVEPFARYYGFDTWVGQVYEREGNRFTGEAVKTHKDKHLILEQLIEKHGLTLEDSYACGDSHGDISMLEMVDFPIAINPGRYLLKTAQKNSWKIVIERKDVMYELIANANGKYELQDVRFH